VNDAGLSAALRHQAGDCATTGNMLVISCDQLLRAADALDGARAALAQHAALRAAHADMLRRIEADGYSYCTEHGIQKWRGSLQLPKGYHGCGPCYWEQWYERKMDALAVQPHASVARKEGDE
jgi:hypothetical protein